MPSDELVEAVARAERDIRIAIWNAAMNGGMGQDLSQALIRRAMDEPTMKRALAAIAAAEPSIRADERERAAKVAEKRHTEWLAAMGNGLKRVEVTTQYAEGAATEAEVLAHAIRGGEG